jgi:hypothetical protein
MARNFVQFQKGISDADFDCLYGTEEQCVMRSLNGAGPKGLSVPFAVLLNIASLEYGVCINAATVIHKYP